MRGARETFTPALTPCCNVSDITRVNSGPGENPADMPRTIPDIKKANMLFKVFGP